MLTCPPFPPYVNRDTTTACLACSHFPITACEGGKKRAARHGRRNTILLCEGKKGEGGSLDPTASRPTSSQKTTKKKKYIKGGGGNRLRSGPLLILILSYRYIYGRAFYCLPPLFLLYSLCEDVREIRRREYFPPGSSCEEGEKEAIKSVEAKCL